MNKRLITFLLLLLAIPAATIISADEYVVNGNFEDGDKGWLMVPGSVVEDSVGFNGTGGLKVFRLSNDEPYLVNHQYVDVEPGTPYRLSAMVKAEGIGPGETSIGLEYTDENGKWIGGDYIAGPKGTSEWREVTTSCQVPLNAAKSSVVVYIRKGSTGTAYFDVVSLRNFDEPPRLQMVYPVQGIVRRGGCPIRFQAGLLGNTKGLEAFAGMRVRTTVKDALGEVVFSGEKALDGSSAEFMLPALEDDEVVISGELLDAEGNFLANSAETRCKVVDEATAAPKGACYIDEYGRTIVDGEPFLPIGLYMSSIEDEEEIEMIFDSDYNCLMPYNIHKTGFETLDKLDAHGVKVIFSLKDLYEIPRTRTTFESIRKQLGMEGAAPEDIVTHFVTKFREHPSILAGTTTTRFPLPILRFPRQEGSSSTPLTRTIPSGASSAYSWRHPSTEAPATSLGWTHIQSGTRPSATRRSLSRQWTRLTSLDSPSGQFHSSSTGRSTSRRPSPRHTATGLNHARTRCAASLCWRRSVAHGDSSDTRSST